MVNCRLLFTLMVMLCILGSSYQQVFKYQSHAELELYLKKLTRSYPSITKLYSIGKSVNGRSLLVMEISENPGKNCGMKPNFKYIGNIHGDEVVGRQILLNLIEYLLKGYEKNTTITQIINSTRIHIFPSMNPDGYNVATTQTKFRSGRHNAYFVDLNRDFPDPFRKFITSKNSHQKETKAVLKWLTEYPFVLSANLHGGALVANYPYDNNQNGWNIYSRSPDDDIYRYISKIYSYSHKNMWKGNKCVGDYFKDGISNGAEWYIVSGGMQDYNYRYTNCFEITLEVSCNKQPPERELKGFWSENKNALINYMQQVHLGIKGHVYSASTKKGIANATIKVTDRSKLISSWKDGAYWRLLLPGRYNVEFSANGYKTQRLRVEVPKGRASIIDVYL